TGKIARPHRQAWHAANLAKPQPVARGVVVSHEEQAVLAVEQFRNQNRSRQSEPELVALEGIFGRVHGSERVGARIESGVAQELEQSAMKAVASGLGGDINLAGGAAKLGREDAGLHLELLNGVDGGQEDI